jgi:glucosamine 6-phosphate synthetase-like amidotransferase/phosphosugar isomerase protein
MQDSVMLKNIGEQAEVVRRSLALALPLPDWLLEAQRLAIVACGSSRHAALVAQDWFESLAQVPVRVLDAAECCDRLPLLESGTVVIAISQSGKTTDVLETLRGIEQLRSVVPQIHTLSLVNQADSPLALRTDATIVTPAWTEDAVAATKSFTAQLAVLARLVLHLAETRCALSPTQVLALQMDLAMLPDGIEDTLQKLDQQGLGQGHAQSWMEAESIVLLGRGLQRSIALEGALKFKELCYVHAEGFGSGDFCHGPMAIVSPNMPIIALLPSEKMPDDKMRSNLDRFRAWGSPVIGIGPQNAEGLSGLDQVLEVEFVANWLMPFVMVLPLQLLAYDWARSRQLDVDRPRYLTKFIGK